MAPAVTRRFYTVREVAEILGISERKVRDLCEGSELTAQKVGCLWRIPVAPFEKRFGQAGPS